MALMDVELPDDVMSQFQALNDHADEIFGEMTKCGAEYVLKNVKMSAPDVIADKFKLSKTYKTPSDNGINTKVYCSGYIPFSDPNRKYFSRNAKGTMYHTDKGVPVPFLAIMYEYGRSNIPFTKHPFFRKSFKEREIERLMLRKQQILASLRGIEFESVDASEVPFL